jgi:diguanylate cyclase (GGDEF)-like protein
VAVKRLAAANRQWNPEEAFIAGLVFRIGQLVLATVLPAEYEPVLRSVSLAEDNLADRERASLGTDHLEIGYQLLLDWKLPETIWGAMEPLAVLPRPAGDEADRRPATIMLRLADEIAAFMVQDKQQQARGMDALIARAAELGKMDRDEFRPLFEQICREWVAYGELLAITTSAPPDLDALEIEAEEHRDTLRLAAEIEVASLRNENLQLSHLANRDRLTGLLNRGAFDDKLAGGVAAAAAKSSSLGLLMIDLDRFKAINDGFGHQTGDEVLRHVARIFHTCLKAPAEAFRYGGEEFAVLLPAVQYGEAGKMAETLRQAIGVSPHVAGANSISLTVSIGVAWARWPDKVLTPAALVQAADQRLYEAKQAGRNTSRPIFIGKPAAGKS